jgi:hypothetical protein
MLKSNTVMYSINANMNWLRSVLPNSYIYVLLSVIPIIFTK